MDLVVAMTTSYVGNDSTTQTRYECAIKTVRAQSQLGIPTVIVDHNTPSSRLDNFRMPHVNIYAQQSRGMGASRREAIAHAQETKCRIIVYNDPEKYGLAPHIEACLNEMDVQNADFLIPARASFTSYPQMQTLTETQANDELSDLSGLRIDWMFGPRFFASDQTHYFLNCNSPRWGAHFIPLIQAHLDGKRIVSKDINYVHPPEQTQEEDRGIKADIPLFFRTSPMATILDDRLDVLASPDEFNRALREVELDMRVGHEYHKKRLEQREEILREAREILS